MAIQVDILESQYGVPFKGAYFRITVADISRVRDVNRRFSVMIDVAGYAAKPGNEDTREVDFRRYHAPLADIESQVGDNFLAKCYAWVMKQPDMTGSVGV